MAFRVRHLGNNLKTIKEMLSKTNNKWGSVDEFIERVIPPNIYLENLAKKGDVFKPKTEVESLQSIRGYFNPSNEPTAYVDALGVGVINKPLQEKPLHYMIGMDFNESETPNVIARNLLENPKWYTAYTPYQAEISQGRLESLFNFQTMVCELTDLPVSNCSLLDSASASSEAMSVAFNFHKQKRRAFFCDVRVHPVIQETLKTRGNLLGIDIVISDFLKYDFKKEAETAPFCGVLFAYPDINGNIIIDREKIEEVKETGALLASHNDIMSLMMVTPPGQLGVDISFGTTQRFGLPLWNGGPHSAFFAMKDNLTRFMPGRIVGKSKCRNGEDAFRLALQTREQHIRKEKALSNICTSQALLANTSTMYAIYHGKEALIEKSVDIFAKTRVLSEMLSSLNNKIVMRNKSNFNFDRVTFSLVRANPGIVHSMLKRNGFVSAVEEKRIEKPQYLECGKLRNFENEGSVSLSVNERTSLDNLHEIYKIIATISQVDDYSISNKYILEGRFMEIKEEVMDIINNRDEPIPELEFIRKNNQVNSITNKPYLSNELFADEKSETWMLRYINHLVDKDYSLVDGMIPLGSCTMKLNATSQMIPISWNELQNVHPYSQYSKYNLGYNKMIDELSKHLLEITGLDAINYQSNSGAMGELSGLAVIKAYQKNTRPSQPRNIILIPESAHGTNFTSAVLAGFKIKKFKDELNSTEFGELCASLGDSLAGLMITYPTTYGLFNSDIGEICDEIHKHGGLVYMDGANMNAQSGLTSPGVCGADICHLNLHKTFCIPHGGGGPGMGPICVKDVLKKYLPSNPIIKTKYCGTEQDSYGTITMSPNSSASILSIPLVYLQTMGSEGVRMSSKQAIINANYLKDQLEPYFNIFKLDNVKSDLVGHEFIIDLQEFYKLGITDKDVAKRLIDYNFHPPTMAWPIPKSIMIEPTESEDLAELDRFVEAMISIKQEIEKVESGEYDKENNPLVNAPHSLDDIIEWQFPYTIEEGLYPIKSLRNKKNFPTKSRIDDIWGDRNLVVRRD